MGLDEILSSTPFVYDCLLVGQEVVMSIVVKLHLVC